MRRWHVIIAFFLIAQTASGQNHGCLGIEITEFIRIRNARLRVSYAISEQWSAEATSSFHIYSLWNNLEETAADRGTCAEVAFRHWSQKCYKGVYFSFGAWTGFSRGTDMKFSLGYSLPIWKGLGTDIGYGFKVIDTIKHKTPSSGEITLEIHYIF